MPFGLTNAPATFQHLMETCLGEMHLKWYIIYLDDIIVFSKMPEEHIERLRGMFVKLAAAGLRLKLSKCKFFKPQVTYLGHIVSQNSIETDPKKIEAIKKWPVPKTVTEVRSFLQFMNYYHKFIPKYAINQLVFGEDANKKKALVDWTEECQVAFEQLKHLCSQTPILAYANYKKPFKLHTDASEHGLGAILYQKQDDNMERVIAYANRTLPKPERNYDTHKLEFLALKWSIMKRFHKYLYGGHFDMYTDNNPLTYILTTAKLDAIGQRWVASLVNYNFKIFYRSGKLNVEADALSCILWESAQVEHMEPLIVKTMLQSKLESEISFPEERLPVKLLLKSMTVDTTLKLTQKDWVKEQMDDDDINKIVQLLKSNKLSTYMAQEMDSSAIQILLKYEKDLLLKNRLLYWKTILKHHLESVTQFVLPKRFIHKEILACHDDNGHLGMEQTLWLLQENFSGPKWKKTYEHIFVLVRGA